MKQTGDSISWEDITHIRPLLKENILENIYDDERLVRTSKARDF